MDEHYILKCNFGKNSGKFIYKCLANNGTPVWASSMEHAMKFELKEFAELFALDKNIVGYDLVSVLAHKKD